MGARSGENPDRGQVVGCDESGGPGVMAFLGEKPGDGGAPALLGVVTRQDLDVGVKAVLGHDRPVGAAARRTAGSLAAVKVTDVAVSQVDEVLEGLSHAGGIVDE